MITSAPTQGLMPFSFVGSWIVNPHRTSLPFTASQKRRKVFARQQQPHSCNQSERAASVAASEVRAPHPRQSCVACNASPSISSRTAFVTTPWPLLAFACVLSCFSHATTLPGQLRQKKVCAKTFDVCSRTNGIESSRFEYIRFSTDHSPTHDP